MFGSVGLGLALDATEIRLRRYSASLGRRGAAVLLRTNFWIFAVMKK